MKFNVNNKNIFLILIASFCYMACPMMVTPLITGYAKIMGASGVIMGVIGGLMNICSLVVRPVAGNLADIKSKYLLATIGSIFMLLACICYMFSNSTIMLVFARLIHGIGFSFCSVCISTWMANMLPKDKIGSGMGLFGTMNALSMAIAPSIGIWFSEKYNHKVAFAIAAGFAAMVLFVIQFISDKGLPLIDIKQKNNAQLVNIHILPVAVIVTMFTIPYCATQSFLVNYVQMREITVSTGLFFPAYAIVLMVLRITLRKYFDKFPFCYFVVLCSLSSTLSIICLQTMRGNLFLILAAVFMAGGYGIICSVAQSTAILMAGKGKRGLANSTYYIGLDMGMALGPLLGGVIYGELNVKYFYMVFLFTIPIILIVGMQKRLFRINNDFH